VRWAIRAPFIEKDRPMKLIAAAALLLTATPVLAQTATAPAAPATAPAAPVATTGAAAATKFTIDTPIEQLIADPAAKAVLEASIPGISSHPSLEQFKALSLTAVQPYSGGAITDAMIAKITADLAAIK